MRCLSLRAVQFLWLIMLLSFSDVYSGIAFGQTQSQTEIQARSLVQARRDQEEQIIQLADEIQKVTEQQRLILEEIDRMKKFVR